MTCNDLMPPDHCPQNPRNTPVKVTMNDASISSLHVSQNIPQNSPMEVGTVLSQKMCNISVSE